MPSFDEMSVPWPREIAAFKTARGGIRFDGGDPEYHLRASLIPMEAWPPAGHFHIERFGHAATLEVWDA